MSKRLTDIGKWDKIWFRKLKPVYKCFWNYVCDRCDFSGIWEVDFETANHFIGENLNISEIKDLFKKQYIELNGGSRWLIKDFIAFQYGSFNEQNKMFNPIKNNLSKYGVSMGDIWGIYPGKDKVTVTVKVKDKDKEGNKRKEINAYTDFEVLVATSWNSLHEKYPTLNKILTVTSERRIHLKKRFENSKFIQAWPVVLEKIPQYPFLLGVNDRGWKASFDWLIENDLNYVKVLEGKYGNS